MSKNKILLNTLLTLFEHIKEVQSNVTELNHSSMTLLGDAIFDTDIEISEDGFVALQHQDILTQQLGATSELLETICKCISEDTFTNFEKNIASSLEIAKEKKEAYSGNAFEKKHEDLVELF